MSDKYKKLINDCCDSGVTARLKGMSPDLAPIILRLLSSGSFVGVAEACLSDIEKVFQKRLRLINLRWGALVLIMFFILIWKLL